MLNNKQFIVTTEVRTVRNSSVCGFELRDKRDLHKDHCKENGGVTLPKLYSAELLPDLDKVIFLDQDMFVFGDIGDLWDEFRHFSATDVAGLVLDTSSYGETEGSWVEWQEHLTKSTTGFNGGVQLHHLARMRADNFSEGLFALVEEMVETGIVLSESDQSIWTYYSVRHPNRGVHQVP